jgi:hypothetical protein
MWSNSWNKNWQAKPKYLEKTYTSAIFSAKNITKPDLWQNSGRRGGKPATNSGCQEISKLLWRRNVYYGVNNNHHWNLFWDNWLLSTPSHQMPFKQYDPTLYLPLESIGQQSLKRYFKDIYKLNLTNQFITISRPFIKYTHLYCLSYWHWRYINK